jgi:hypothetical protein
MEKFKEMRLAGMSGWEWGSITAVFLLALLLRTAVPSLTEFKADEARLITLAWEMAEGQNFASAGD